MSSVSALMATWWQAARHVAPDVTFLLPDGGVLTVGQRAGGAVTHPGDIELISTEVLTLRPARGGREGGGRTSG